MGKIWGNCNSIINKIYFKKKKGKGQQGSYIKDPWTLKTMWWERIMGGRGGEGGRE